MDWNKGYTATYYGCYVDAGTWRDLERFEITSGSVSKGSDDLRESAEVVATSFDQTKEQWIRLYLDAAQNGDIAHEALFTGLATSPSQNINGNIEERKVEIYSVLKPADDILLERGWYAPMGWDGAELIKELLEVIPAPVTITGTAPKLKDNIVAEDGETNLSMAEKILQAINWRYVIDGDGSITLTKKANSPAARFNADTTDIVEPKISISKDWFGCPNVFRAVSEDDTAVAEDNSDSELSIKNRGRKVMMEELNAVTTESESLLDYAERRLAEEQQVQKTASYTRRYLPDVHVGDMINFHYSQLVGDFVVDEQKITFGYNAQVSEEVIQYAGD